jgi:microcompartment protein CcmK/EutM
MFLGKVVGTVWSTKKTPNLEGIRFLIVHPCDLNKEPTTNVVVAADRMGAGVGETVICAYGRAARSAIGDQEMSIEAAVVAIVDEVDIDLKSSQSHDLVEIARDLKGRG